MANKIKDTDYLAISARVRAMETTLLTAERMERLLEARSDEEVSKLLQDCGYPELDAARPEAMDAVLSQAREELLTDLGDGAPDPRYIDIFKLKYDYHNAKAILKAAAMGTSPDRMLMDMGRIGAAELKTAVESGELDKLPGALPAAVAEAKSVLDTTRDPQLSDIVLDRWMYRDMAQVAEDTGSQFLRGYVETQIDAANLRALIRTLRMGKNVDFLAGVLFESGTVEPAAILAAANHPAGGLNEIYGPTRFAQAAEAGEAALKGGSLTEFEKRCDDAVSDYLAGAQMIPFGEAPLLAYLAARETEYTNIRILLMGRAAGLSPEVIRSRLRRTCAYGGENMAATYSIAVIGDWESVMGFRALGLDTYPVTSVEEARKTVHDLAKTDCAVIYLTETLAKDMADVLDRYKDNIQPAIILIPGREGSLGIGKSNIQSAIERAVGADIL